LLPENQKILKIKILL